MWILYSVLREVGVEHDMVWCICGRSQTVRAMLLKNKAAGLGPAGLLYVCTVNFS